MPALNWPASMDADSFLRDYWQKRPLLLRNALPGFVSPLDADELAGLACEQDVESRLVIEHSQPPWQLRHGPFSEVDFAALPATGWSLLVQDVDKHLPELAAIVDAFDFVPSWRFDDLMVSHAPAGGSVGAHLDAYDVFLVQGAGERTWSIGAQPPLPDWIDDAQLRVLANFKPDASWTLQPGDALYLPPGIAHHGVAGDGCLTWSVGFRAPSHAELMIASELPVVCPPDEDALYADPDLTAGEAVDGLISAASLQRANAIVSRYSGGRAAVGSAWFGELVTQPKAWLRAEPGLFGGGAAQLADSLVKGAELQRNGMSRVARSTDNALLFADGDSFELPPTCTELARLICSRRLLGRAALEHYLDKPEAVELLATLTCRGVLSME